MRWLDLFSLKNKKKKKNQKYCLLQLWLALKKFKCFQLQKEKKNIWSRVMFIGLNTSRYQVIFSYFSKEAYGVSTH